MSVAIDTGGTFTDAVHADGRVRKVPSSRHDPAAVIGRVLAEMPPESTDRRLLHGTTVATNAVLERRLARVGLIVNAGFKDLLVIGRQARPELHAREPERPWLPIADDLTEEVAGRIDASGGECEPFDPASCAAAGRRLAQRGAEALAVVLLHAYANPRHETEAAEALRGTGLPITTSSSLDPEFREVERGVCTVINAGLRPPVGRYLERLRATLSVDHVTGAAGGPVDARVMTSEGGLLGSAEVAAEPARLLVSGPAGGLVAAQVFGNALEEGPLVTLDMGGTSTDVAWIDGALPRDALLHIGGHDVRLPSLEIHTVGAGGGSLVSLDRGGALHVGPQSAGADPGPVAYGVGDTLTVTDANLLLGRIAVDGFAGDVALDVARAERVARRLARQAGLTLRRLLEGIVALTDLAMARASLRALTAVRLNARSRDRALRAAFVYKGKGAWVHPSAVVEASILGDNVVVGANSYITGSILGAGTIVEQRAHVEQSTLGPKTFVSKNSSISACCAFGDTDVCTNGIQGCVIAPKCGLTSFARPLDTVPGDQVRVVDEGELRAVGELPCGVCFGPECFVGGGVIIAPGRAIPRGVRLVANPDDVLRRPPRADAGLGTIRDGGFEEI